MNLSHQEPNLSFEKAQEICKTQVILAIDHTHIELVLGAAGIIMLYVNFAYVTVYS